jgi:glycosidase
MTEEGIPCLYYGTEQEFSGGNDPSNREVLWNTGFSRANDTFQHFSKLARIRAQYPALRRGDTNVVWSSSHTGNEEDAGIIAYERTGGDAGDAYALVLINSNDKKDSSTSNGDAIMKLTVGGVTLVDVLNPEQDRFPVLDSGVIRITVPKQRARILVPE